MWCRMIRWSAGSKVDAGRPLTGWASRHLARCPACRAWAGGREALVGELRVGSADRTVAPPGLVERVLFAVERADRQSVGLRPSRLLRFYPHLLAAAASLLVVFTAVALRGLAPAPPHRPTDRAASLDGLGVIQSAITPPTAADRGTRAVADLAGGMMDRELGKLADDAISVGRSLLAVLPTFDPGEPGDEPSGPSSGRD